MSINLENNTVDIGYSDNPGDTDFGQQNESLYAICR